MFQELLKKIQGEPTMLELGAYWGHYSMWLKNVIPEAYVHLVEPDESRLLVGQKNFAHNGIVGSFEQSFVGRNQFQVDDFLASFKRTKLNILHADIQGYEVEMLEACKISLSGRLIDYLFISTHTQLLHKTVCETLSSYGYRIEISADFDNETTSFDGFVFASSPGALSVFNGFVPLGRQEITNSRPIDLTKYILSFENTL